MVSTLSIPATSAEGVGDPVLSFVRPLIGFPRSSRYALAPLPAPCPPFARLESLDEEGLGFVVVPPGLLFDDYVIEIPETEVALLGLAGDGEDATVLTLVTRCPGAASVVNLMGPVVASLRTGRAAQLVLADSGYEVAVPVDAGSARPRSR